MKCYDSNGVVLYYLKFLSQHYFSSHTTLHIPIEARGNIMKKTKDKAFNLKYQYLQEQIISLLTTMTNFGVHSKYLYSFTVT